MSKQRKMTLRHKRGVDKTRREKRLAEIAEMYLKGATQYSIGEKFGVSQAQVSHDLDLIRERWLESQLENFDFKVSEEIQKINRLEREAWDAWERSKRDAQSHSETVTDKGSSSTKVRRGQVGDPRYMEVAMSCINKRCEILGLDAPKKNALTDPTGKKPAKLQIIEVKDREQAMGFNRLMENLVHGENNTN